MPKKKRDDTPTKLDKVVLSNLGRLRSALRLTQDDFANAMKLGRSAYTKKETGIVPVALADLHHLIEAFDFGLADLFRGYDRFYFKPRTTSLSDEAQRMFPILENLIMAANNLDKKLVRMIASHLVEEIDNPGEEREKAASGL